MAQDSEAMVAAAWTAELNMFTGVVGAACPRGTDARDVQQAATGVLLLRSLPDDVFEVALRHVVAEARTRRVAIPGDPDLAAQLAEARAVIAECGRVSGLGGSAHPPETVVGSIRNLMASFKSQCDRSQSLEQDVADLRKERDGGN